MNVLLLHRNRRHVSATRVAIFTQLVKLCVSLLITKYRVVRNDCRGFNNLSYTIQLR